VTGILVAVLIGMWKISRAKKDTNKIVNFLRGSANTTEYIFRTTHRISSETNLPEDKIRKLCSKSRLIIRNQKEKESWRLADT